jgi:hypothetical protein
MRHFGWHLAAASDEDGGAIAISAYEAIAEALGLTDEPETPALVTDVASSHAPPETAEQIHQNEPTTPPPD